MPSRVGRYMLHAAFARGGMASVHLGKLRGASGFSRVVAIKRMHPLYADSEAHYRMLRDEARILSRIHHPNVIPLLDVVQDDHELCLVMDYVRGVSLADMFREASSLGERIPPPIASAIVCDLLRGLHAAHEARAEDGTPLEVVHRDVSPHNVLVGADGIARVLDFGIAKALRKEHLTVSGDLKGKLSYMAPEQLQGLPATRQSDLFSTGVVLFETLVGEKLHPEGDGVVAAVLGTAKKIPVPSARASNIPRALDAVVARALALEPRERFGSAEEMAIALAAACPPAGAEQVKDLVERLCGDELERRANLAREVERSSDAPLEDPAEAAVAAVKTETRVRRSGLGATIVAIAIGGLLVALALTATRRPSPVPGPVPDFSAASLGPAIPPPPASTPATATPPPPTTESASPVASASASPSARPPPPRRPKTESKSEAKPETKAARSCVPPFRIDDAGVKHYYPECL